MKNKILNFVKRLPKIIAWIFGIYVGLVLGFLLLMGLIALATGNFSQYWTMLMGV